MPDGGKLSIETCNVVLDEHYAGINSDVTAGNYVMVAVTDSGHGIPADILNHVFEPFFTTKDVDKGSGLGLSMVYGFVKQSNGHIKIYSEEGHGTTVRIYLPQVSVATELAVAQSSSSIEGGHETILVVEDDNLVRTFVVGQIQSLGYDTLAAVNAVEAMTVIDGPRRIDLLFTDMIMPGSMNGRQLADAALQRRAALKILFTSGYSNEAIIHHGHLDRRCVAARQAVSQVGSCPDDTNRTCGLIRDGGSLPDRRPRCHPRSSQASRLPRSDGPVIETGRLILRRWRGADVAPNTAMLADPVSGRFITADGKPVTDAFVGWRNAAIMSGHWMLHGVGMFVVEEKSSGEFVGRVGPWFPPGWPGFEVGWGIASAAFAARATRWRRRGRRSTGRLRPSSSIEIIHCIDRENTASQAVARRLGAEKGREFDLFGHVADVWVTRRDKWQSAPRRKSNVDDQ